MACDLNIVDYNCYVTATVITKTDIQTPVVMFYFLFKYQVSVTCFLAFMDQISCVKLH